MSDLERFNVYPDKRFVTICNDVLWDRNVSVKAKGVLITILNLPDDWRFSVRGLISVIKEGKAAVYAALNELIEAGYVEKTEVRDSETGKFLKVRYSAFGTKDPAEKKRIREQYSPLTDFRDTDNRDTGNRTQLINKRTKYKRTNKELTYSDDDFSKIERQAMEVFSHWFPDAKTDRFIKFLLSQVTAGAADPKWVDAWDSACQRFSLNGFNPCQKMVDAYRENLAGVPMMDRFQ